ncbi:MAG: 4-hydroxy-3-methylbut-2-enyl diphosphate reductase [Deltaproteobacteria bacterium]|nr:4-hydroxy-3-methylbut-2-enyl diphosphate reductase [Deltaproteobacteria bacterium]
MEREVIVASPRGFCAGVSHAIEIVDLVLEREGAPVYVRHEIVHNKYVVEDLRGRGAVFVDELADVPAGALVIFSAHGVSPAVREEARARGVRVVDATCPLVTKVHVEALRYARDGYEILVIGHRGHVEVVGTLGHAPEQMHLIETVADVAVVTVRDPDRVAVVTQTTLSVDDTRDIVDAIRQRFPNVHLPSKDDICYATQNRQTAVKELARQADRVLVIGSPTSSNANRLVEVARNAGTAAQLIEDASAIDPAWLGTARAVGLTAGASTPELLVEAAVARLRTLGFARVRDLTTAVEHVAFPLPRALRASA